MIFKYLREFSKFWFEYLSIFVGATIVITLVIIPLLESWKLASAAFLRSFGARSCLVCAHIFGLSAIHRSVSRNSFDSGENF